MCVCVGGGGVEVLQQSWHGSFWDIAVISVLLVILRQAF